MDFDFTHFTLNHQQGSGPGFLLNERPYFFAEQLVKLALSRLSHVCEIDKIRGSGIP